MSIRTIYDAIKFFSDIQKDMELYANVCKLKEQGIIDENSIQISDIDLINIARSKFMDNIALVYINKNIDNLETVKDYDNLYEILQKYDKEHPKEFTQYMQQYFVLTDFYNIVSKVKIYINNSQNNVKY